MTESFPSAPRAPTSVRLCAVAIGLVGIVLATRTTLTSTAWIGRTFPGFLLMSNRVVPSIGLANWSGSTVADLYQSQIVAMDGRPIASATEVYDAVAARPPGVNVRYSFRQGTTERDVTIETQLFGVRDWTFLFGAYLLNSIVYLSCGLIVWVLRPHSSLTRSFLAFGVAWAAFFLTAMDLYGPSTFVRLHFVTEPLASAAALQMVMLFPQPHRLQRWRFAGYAASAALAIAYEIYLYEPSVFSTILMVDMLYLGVVGMFLGLRLIGEYWYGTSQLARQRVRVMTLGTLFGFGLPGLVLVISAAVWGQVSMNIAAFTPFLFALSLAYAIVKHDLLEIDAMVKRGAYYLLLTGAVGAAYMGAVVVFNSVLQENAFTGSAAFPVLFTLVVLLIFNPLRSRLQGFVDRVFFRTRYDGAEMLATLGSRLGSALARDRIASLVCDTVETAIPNAATRLFVVDRKGALRGVGGDVAVPAALVQRLALGRVITAFDPPEIYGDEAVHEAVRASLASLEAEIAVPLQFGSDLTGALTAGPKRSGLFYTAGDAGFLSAVAHQAAIALANAQSYQALMALNASLEERVRERTTQLEAAYQELKAAETHLVQSEKMASLGRLVAGVAHEINNPVSFIASSVAPLRRRLERASTAPPADVARLLAEAREIIDIMARGAERTTAIVRDLRSFSRLGEAVRKPADLREGIEVTLRLLESRWRDRLTIHREYDDTLQPVECDPGQINQVFMNLLANACDATQAGGNIWLRTETRGTDACVTIRDDGPGIPPESLGRIFEPFFTTKEVGRGTGLGLAIAHGIVAAHGGRIEVESTPGAGATFRVILPATADAVVLDRAASAGR
jgi:signal transduction histidine kinase